MPAGVSKRGAGTQQGAARQRRAAHFWSPLNDWWRAYLAEHGRRPVTSEVQSWWLAHADSVWGQKKPSWKEARIHAKCLRSTEQVKNYFRAYRARSKGVAYGDEPAGKGSKPSSSKAAGRRGQQSESDADDDDADEDDGGSGPSTADCAAEPFHAATAAAATSTGMARSTPSPLSSELMHASLNPATITTGNGMPAAWQLRSASERFASSARPHMFDTSSGCGGVPEAMPVWERSHSSVVFRPPSLSLRTKPLSPFVLSQVKQEPGVTAAAPGLEPQQWQGQQQQQQQQEAAGAATPATPALPSSPMLSVAAKSQSFSVSAKRRHTTEEAPGPSSSIGTPATLRQAASFSYGHSHGHGRYGGSAHAPLATAPSGSLMDDGLPHDNSMQGVQPGGGFGDGGLLCGVGAEPLSNPQTMRYAPRSSFEAAPGAGMGAQGTLPLPLWDGEPHCTPGAPAYRRSTGSGGSGGQDAEAGAPHPEPAPSTLMTGVDRQLVEHIARDAAARSSYLQRSSAACSTGGAGAGAAGWGGAAGSGRRSGHAVGVPVAPHPACGVSSGMHVFKGEMGMYRGMYTSVGMGGATLSPQLAPQGYDAEFANWLAAGQHPEDAELAALADAPLRPPSYPHASMRGVLPHGITQRQHPVLSDPGAHPVSMRSLSFPIAPLPPHPMAGGHRHPLHASPHALAASRMRAAPMQMQGSSHAAMLAMHEPPSPRPNQARGQLHHRGQPHPGSQGQGCDPYGLPYGYAQGGDGFPPHLDTHAQRRGGYAPSSGGYAPSSGAYGQGGGGGGYGQAGLPSGPSAASSSPEASGGGPACSSWGPAHSQEHQQGGCSAAGQQQQQQQQQQRQQQHSSPSQQGQGGDAGPLPQSDSVGLPFQALRVHSSSLTHGEGPGNEAALAGRRSMAEAAAAGTWDFATGGPAWGGHGGMEWEQRMAEEMLSGGSGPLSM